MVWVFYFYRFLVPHFSLSVWCVSPCTTLLIAFRYVYSIPEMSHSMSRVPVLELGGNTVQPLCRVEYKKWYVFQYNWWFLIHCYAVCHAGSADRSNLYWAHLYSDRQYSETCFRRLLKVHSSVDLWATIPIAFLLFSSPQYTSSGRPSVLREHFLVAFWTVSQDRFYSTYCLRLLYLLYVEPVYANIDLDQNLFWWISVGNIDLFSTKLTFADWL